MKIVFVISSLHCGGAERVISNMANYWSDKGHIVSVLKFDSSEEAPFYKLNKEINLFSLNILKPSQSAIERLTNNMVRIYRIRKVLKDLKADIIISFMTETNIRTIIANGLIFRTPVIVSERIDPIEYKVSRLWSLLRRITYIFADHVVVQTENIKDYFDSQIKEKCTIIPNSIISPNLQKEYNCNNIILAMGRLVKQKGLDVLIEAFDIASMNQENEWELHIYGDGQLHKSLEDIIQERSLVGKVSLKGITKKPAEVMMKSDIFVLSSRAEGFPNVLLEAMACGLPVISTDCNSGPRDIITDGINGLLVEVDNIKHMADAMKSLMTNADKRMELGQSAIRRSRDYDEDTIMERWETLITEVTNKSWYLKSTGEGELCVESQEYGI